MATQNYDYLVVPALGTDTVTSTGSYEPPRRPHQPPLRFMTVEADFNPFPQAVLVLLGAA